MPRDKRLTLEQSKIVQSARVLGAGTALPVLLTDAELSKLVAVVCHDTNHDNLIPASLRHALAAVGSYYELPLEWFEQTDSAKIDLTVQFLSAADKIVDFATYFACLCSLHKRRKKYSRILSAQPLPTMLQVAPRSLLEFGTREAPALASWLAWRKWFFDIDNRAGQETGYLFEPILASALGGTPFSAKKSPVRRTKDNNKARQVDCIVGTTAYEFKLRVTIAASGQGRFGEELEFAVDCRASGFTPVLMVLDPTPSPRLTDLTAQFEAYGGRAYIGKEAWEHIEEEGGETMGTFIEKYVRRPIQEMDANASELLSLAVAKDGEVAFSVRMQSSSRSYEWRIPRHEDQSLASDEGDESE